MSATTDAISGYGGVVAARFATGGGEPEDLLRGPFEQLVADFAQEAGISKVVLTGEHHLAADRVRPDYAVFASSALVGFIELKAPGKGVDTGRYKGHDRQQWERLACLPNVLYSDGQAFALYRDGERIGKVARRVGDVTTAGTSLAANLRTTYRVIPSRGPWLRRRGLARSRCATAIGRWNRAWIIPEKRVIHRPRAELWQVQRAPGQFFLTTIDRMPPSAGPASSFAAYVPDLDHHHGRGGRASPLWLDSAGTRPNVVPGLLEVVSPRLDVVVTGPDLFAYVAAITAHPGYVERFRHDPLTPGLRIPLTANADRLARAVELGMRVIWLHTTASASPTRLLTVPLVLRASPVRADRL